MKGPSIRNVPAILLTLVLVAAFIALSHASTKAKRGDYPRCQEECLMQLTKRMTELTEDYKRTGDKLVYQERVEQARFDYDECIVDCKELLPVK